MSNGPLSDGDLTGAELSELLHHVATPHLPDPHTRYLAEGFGSLDDNAIALARDVLAGSVLEPESSEEDLMHEQVEVAHHALFDAKCR